MTHHDDAQPPRFVRGNDHLDRLLSDPQLAADVAQANAEAEDMDRAYAMNLAMIRKAAQLTQVEVAKRLGVGQAASPPAALSDFPGRVRVLAVVRFAGDR